MKAFKGRFDCAELMDGWIFECMDGWMDGWKDTNADVHARHCILSIAAAAPQEEEPSSPPVLGELRAPHITSDSVQLEWSVPEGTFDSFTLQYRDAQGQPESLLLDGGSRRVTVPGLSPSQRYNFYLYGVIGQKRLGPISLDTLTGQEGFAAMALAPWVLGMRGGGCWGRACTGAFVRGMLDQSLNPCVDVYFLHGVLSIAAPAPQEKPPTKPRLGELKAPHVSPDSVQLQWSVPEGTFDSFTLQYRDAQGQPQVLPVDGGSRTLTVPGLSPSRRYKFNLYGLWGRTRLGPVSTDTVTAPLPHPHPRDCAEEQLNGPGPSRPTLIFLGGDPARPLRVFCDMDTDGGGWLVFQRRQDGGTDFWRGWDEYERGFGNVSGEFWLGNAALHALTSSSRTELRVDLRSGPDAAFAHYRDFHVDGPGQHYGLRLGAYSGTAGDALSYHAGSPFSTRDRDPRGRPRPCAVAYMGAWWYHNCHYANLNGRYGTPLHHQVLQWGFEFSIPFTEMKLRPQRD
uniref:Uncharacterized protein n=1 Tax=Melopsittacus undulatus TaxID=13146 RepID=A0A8V5GJP7_MELUD